MATITGTSDSDDLDGSNNADTIYGYAGGDSLNGEKGDDLLDAGASADHIIGGAGIDTMYGGAGDDVFEVNTAAEFKAGEIYDGGSGYDSISIFGDVDLTGVTFTSMERIFAYGVTVAAGTTLAGFSEIDISELTIKTGGTVLLQTGAGFSAGLVNLSNAGNTLDLTEVRLGLSISVIGGDGNDVVLADAGAQEVLGGGGDDSISTGAGADSIDGGDGNDTLNAGAGDDTIGAGGKFAGDEINGGAGDDLLDIVNGGNLVKATLLNIETIQSFDYLTLTTHQINDVSAIYTLDLDLSGKGHADFTDVDMYLYTSINLSSKGNTVDATGNTVGLSYFGNKAADVILGGDGNDSIVGDAGNDSIAGGGGRDTIEGGAGTDTLSGGDGNDVFFVSANKSFDVSEIYSGDRGGDILQFEEFNHRSFDLADAAGHIDVETLSAAYIDFTMTTTQLTSFDSVTAAGVKLADPGSLDFVGTFISTTLDLNAGGNSVDFHDTDGRLTVNGAAGDDSVVGTVGSDDISGGGGNDRLDGGEADDLLRGNAGADNFVFSSVLNNANVDDLLDFRSGTDRILLDHAVFTALAPGALAAADFESVDDASDTSAKTIIYDSGTRTLYYNANGSAAGGLQAFANFNSVATDPALADILVS